MIFGKYPFEGISRINYSNLGSTDEEIMNNILQDDLIFPKDNTVSKSCKILIEKLLEKNSKERIDLFDSSFHEWISEE